MAESVASRQDQLVFDGHNLLGRLDVECPVCGKVSRPEWRWLYFEAYDGDTNALPARQATYKYEKVALEWMRCAHEECEQLLIRIQESRPGVWIDGTGAPLMTFDSWIARPRFGESKRQIAAEVKEPLRSDYLEAAALLDISPRMAAVLARSILADLLETCLQLTDFGLNDRINKFRERQAEPKRLRDGAHHFRTIGDFGSHTQKNDQDQIIPVERDDAEWMLDYLDRFLDHYIISPEKDSAVLGKWDKNIADAGRKPIPPIPDDAE
jgi:uncharacterized protein DUF4145